MARAKSVFTDIFVLVALGSIIIGFILNISGVQRPAIYQRINSIFIPSAAIIRKYLKASSLIALMNFVIVPTIVTYITYILGLGNIDNGMPLKVVLILSSMPVGFIAMVPPTIYDLDVELANSNWLVANGLLMLVIP